MRPLSQQDIEAELSYAYLHAIAAKCGMGCKFGSRHDDNAGVDAELTAWGPFEGGGYLTEVDIKVQLKATTAPMGNESDFIPYFLRGIGRYNDLRSLSTTIQRVLVVLFLPKKSDQWLTLSENELVMRRCAYWVSLRGAPESNNNSGETVYIPKKQLFSPDYLLDIVVELSHNRYHIYGGKP